MENHRKEEALQNKKKRRKEQLNLKRGKKKKSMHFRGNDQDEI